MRDARQILEEASTIAVVGASRDRFKTAHSVPAQIQRHGWRIIPVNPYADQIFGERAYRRLADIPEPVDLVNVFRPSADATDGLRVRRTRYAHDQTSDDERNHRHADGVDPQRTEWLDRERGTGETRRAAARDGDASADAGDERDENARGERHAAI